MINTSLHQIITKHLNYFIKRAIYDKKKSYLAFTEIDSSLDINDI